MSNPYDPNSAGQDGNPYLPQENQPGYPQQAPYGQQPYGQQAPYDQQYAQPQYAQPLYPQPQYGAIPYDPQAKSQLAAGLLGIFLGGLGIHRFYLGYTGIGIAQLVLFFFTAGLSSLWGFIEGIMILVGAQSFRYDASGRPLRQ